MTKQDDKHVRTILTILRPLLMRSALNELCYMSTMKVRGYWSKVSFLILKKGLSYKK